MVLAMSQYQLHQTEEARAALARGLEMACAKLPKLESGDLGRDWPNLIFSHALMREAKALIEGGSKTRDEAKASDSPPLRKDTP